MTVPLFVLSSWGCEAAEDGRNRDTISSSVAIAAKARSAVVRIRAQGGMAQPEGAGFFVRGRKGEALIATNYHVVWGASSIAFEQSGSVQGKAKLLGIDKAIDFALLRPDPAVTVAVLDLVDEREIRVGDWLMSVGNFEGVTTAASVGVLSGRTRLPRASLVGQRLVDHLLTDAVLGPGSSGGPVLDARGSVVGMNTAVAGRSRGIGIVTPATLIQHAARELEQVGHCAHAFGGVEVADDSCAGKEPGAMLVTSVTPEGPAHSAGLQVQDCIVAAHGRSLQGANEFRRRMFMAKPGTRWSLDVVRDARRVRVTLLLENAGGRLE